ncbi:MAG: hypothetical protein U0X87_12480 [Anaerolineales bacterium]
MELEKRIREKVAAKLGNQVDASLLDAIIKRTLKADGDEMMLHPVPRHLCRIFAGVRHKCRSTNRGEIIMLFGRRQRQRGLHD